MNFKDLFLPLGLALLVTVAVQYYFSRNTPAAPGQVVSGQVYEVKHDPAAVAPLEWKMDFADVDEKREKTATRISIQTQYARYGFSSAGAAIERVECRVPASTQLIKALNATTLQEKALLVCVAEKTPYFYDLIECKVVADTVILRYRATLPGNGALEKTFTIYQQQPKIDLAIALTMTPETAYVKKLRVFFPSPTTDASVAQMHMFVNDSCDTRSLKLYGKIPEVVHKTWRQPSIFGVSDRFCVHALIGDAQTFVYRAAVNDVDGHYLLNQLEGTEIKGSGSWKMTFYMGPKQASVLRAVDPRLSDVMDYGFLAPLSRLLLVILNFLYAYLRNYGLAIIFMTILVRLLLLPLTIKGRRGMARQMEYQKKVQYIKQRYRNDPERLKAEEEALLRQQDVGGMFSGCLPILLQFPVFIALTRVVSNSIELYQAPFLWIPNLAASDPYYILPIISGVSVLLTQTATSKDTRQQFSGYAMALVIGALTVGLSAGNALYLAMSTLIGVVEAKLLTAKS